MRLAGRRGLVFGSVIAVSASVLVALPAHAAPKDIAPKTKAERSVDVDRVTPGSGRGKKLASAKSVVAKAPKWPTATGDVALSAGTVWQAAGATGLSIRANKAQSKSGHFVVNAGPDKRVPNGLVVQIAPRGTEPEAPTTATPTTDEPTATAPSASENERPAPQQTADPVAPHAVATDLDVRMDYSNFANAYGGGWSQRLSFYAFTPCDDMTGSQSAACGLGQRLDSSNDAVKQTISTTLDAASFETGTMSVALVANAAGASGDYTATPLAPSSTWSAGGQSGDFNWSYPLGVPAGVNGPAPDLAITYSSGSVDGLTSSTNAQPSWVGEGFSLDPGFIERGYRPCYEDKGSGHNLPGGYVGGDLCWRDDNATISFGGKSSKLVQIGSTDVWRMKDDDGTRIEHKNRNASNPRQNRDNDGEYWVVTAPDGTKSYFGLHKRSDTDANSTDSVATVPVYGNHAGEPCRGSSFTSSACDQGWRWGLDYVVDPHGNTMTLFYGRETNRYGQNENASSKEYDRNLLLKRIEYGTRAASDTTGNAPARMVFNTEERCIPGTGVTCESLTEAKAKDWPDVPYDQMCASTSTCSNRWSPTFFSRKRLTKIATQVWDPASSTYKGVDEWDLSHSFPNSGDGEARSLWLRKIQHTGKDGADIATPAVEFSGIIKPNRVDTVGDSMSAFYKWRVGLIKNGTGGQINVAYSGTDCTASDKPSTSALDTNTRRCFPSYYQPIHAEDPLLEFFHKYVVTEIVEVDGTSGTLSDDKVTRYEYPGGGAWRYDSSTIPRSKHRTWNEWRGYGRVIKRTGFPPTQTTYSEVRYLRGMHGNRTDAGGTQTVDVDVPSGATIRDYDHFAGFPVRTQTKLGDEGSVVDLVFNTPWRSAATATDGDLEARLTGTGASETWTRLSSGDYRKTKLTTSYNAHGLPVEVNDSGDTSVGSDNTCTTTTYASDTTEWLIDYPSQQVTTAGTCGTAPQNAADIVSAIRTSYDGLAWNTAPTTGNPTTVRSASGFTSGAITYQVDANTAYDSYGRPTSVTDAAGATTTTGFSPATGIPTQLTQTNALGQQTVTTVNRARSQPQYVVDIRGGRTDYEYDSLGRMTNVWLPARPKSSGKSATHKYAYTVNGTNANVIKTETLRSDPITGPTYNAEYQIYDGLLRERSTQSQAHNPSGGRQITEKIYDSRGLLFSQRGPYYNASAPSGTLVNAAPSTIPTLVDYTYDAAGRQTVQTQRSLGVDKWTTTTYYDGDRVRISPPAGGTATATETDARGNVTMVRQYLGSTPTGPSENTAYTHSPAGQLKTITNPAGTNWSYAYDIRGNRVTSNDPDKGTTTSTYDALDRPVTTTDAKNRTMWTKYDSLGRKTELRDANASGALRASWVYDTVKPGLLTSSTRHTATGEYKKSTTSYDAGSRPLATKLDVPAAETGLYRSGGYASTATYRADGQISTLKLPAATGMATEQLAWTYGATGLVNSFGGSGTFVAATEYNAYGQVSSRTQGNVAGKSIFDMRTYETGTQRLTRQEVLLSGVTGAAADWQRTYNNAGDMTMLRDLNASGTVADTQCFAYDHARRLVQARTSSASNCATAPSESTLGSVDPYWFDYQLAPSGNRTSWTERSIQAGALQTRAHEYSYPAASAERPHAVSSVETTGYLPQTESFDYDATGAMVERSTASTTGQDLEYDVEGHLSSSTDKATGKKTEFVYDADGVRLLKRDASSGTTTLYVGAAEYARNDATNAITPTRHYSLDGGAIAVRTVAGGLKHLVADTQGTAQVQIDAASQTVVKRRYAPYGVERNGSGTTNWDADRGFLNKTRDSSLGTTHLDAREYDPRLGRFTTVDPIIDPTSPQQINPYAYADNNPITSSDPTGLYRDGGVETNRIAPEIVKRGGNSYAQAGGNYVNVVGATQRFVSGNAGPTVNDVASVKRQMLSGGWSPMSLIPKTKGQWAGLGIGLAGGIACPFTGGMGCAVALGASGAAGGAATYAIDEEDPTLSGAAGSAGVGFALGAATFGLGKYGASRIGGNAAKNAPLIKPGSAGGPSAGKPFSQSVRQQELANNPSTCVYCRMETSRPQVDHSIPRSRGGNATLDNAQTTCPHCNASKGARDFPVTPPGGYEGPWPPSWWGLIQ